MFCPPPIKGPGGFRKHITSPCSMWLQFSDLPIASIDQPTPHRHSYPNDSRKWCVCLLSPSTSHASFILLCFRSMAAVHVLPLTEPWFLINQSAYSQMRCIAHNMRFYSCSCYILRYHATRRMSVVRCSPSKGWLLPMGITSSCVSENGKMLAFGMDDGTILVWDDHFGR